MEVFVLLSPCGVCWLKVQMFSNSLCNQHSKDIVFLVFSANCPAASLSCACWCSLQVMRGNFFLNTELKINHKELLLLCSKVYCNTIGFPANSLRRFPAHSLDRVDSPRNVFDERQVGSFHNTIPLDNSIRARPCHSLGYIVNTSFLISILMWV